MIDYDDVIQRLRIRAQNTTDEYSKALLILAANAIEALDARVYETRNCRECGE